MGHYQKTALQNGIKLPLLQIVIAFESLHLLTLGGGGIMINERAWPHLVQGNITAAVFKGGGGGVSCISITLNS